MDGGGAGTSGSGGEVSDRELLLSLARAVYTLTDQVGYLLSQQQKTASAGGGEQAAIGGAAGAAQPAATVTPPPSSTLIPHQLHHPQPQHQDALIASDSPSRGSTSQQLASPSSSISTTSSLPLPSSSSSLKTPASAAQSSRSKLQKEGVAREPSLLDALPAQSCPSDAYLEKLCCLKFEVRFVMDQLIAARELSWSDITTDVLDSLIVEHNTFGSARSYLLELCKEARGYNLKLVHAKEMKELRKSWRHYNIKRSSQDAQVWTTRGPVVSTISCRVSADRITFSGPFEETSSRVERCFGSDRLLRVAFERWEKKGTIESMKAAFRRVWNEGITLGGRRYEFLCWSKSQKRQGKCYFFASSGYDITDGYTASSVRSWLGDFSSIRTVVKFGARLGQAFCKSTATINVPKEHIEVVDDIQTTDHKYTFTDGCGEISRDYMRLVASHLARQDEATLSAIQVRLAGAKGMLAVNPALKSRVILRKSMVKYNITNQSPEHHRIEVIKCASLLKGTLNRQFITLFHALGVPVEYFLDLQKCYIERILECDQEIDTMRTFISSHEREGDSDPIQTEIKKALLAGHSINEPYFKSLVYWLKSGKLRSLKMKARIPVEDSYVLLGVADQSGLLKYGQVYICLKKRDGGMPITGPVVVTKNPCLHPGDIRLLEAVNIPQLRHLTNVVVFPIQGPRPHPSEIAGGDLDGDMYFVSWNRELVKIKPVQPQAASEEYEVEKNKYNQNLPATDSERIGMLREYFLDGLFDMSLGEICNKHQACAELSSHGANDPLCIKLANLFVRAVDADKSADKIVINHAELHRLPMPHFMRNDEKDGNIAVTHRYVHSKGVLGQLYDQAKAAEDGLDRDVIKEAVVLDDDLYISGFEEFMDEARQMYESYRRDLGRLMDHWPKEDLTGKNIAIDQIKAQYSIRFESTKSRGYEVQMRKAYAWYRVCYDHAATQKTPRVSFPWLPGPALYLHHLKCRAVNRRVRGESDALPLPIADSIVANLRFA